MSKSHAQIVYVVGAGFSAGLGFPTINDLLPKMWDRIVRAGLSDDLSKIIRFHHPAFNSARHGTYPNIEELLSEMQANADLFNSSRPATGQFDTSALEERRESLLLELTKWFHDLQAQSMKRRPRWLNKLALQMIEENAQIISFNWDLVLDEILFGNKLDRESYGFASKKSKPTLIKPHGSLNWYEASTGSHLVPAKTFPLTGRGRNRVLAFKPFRAPKSKSSLRRYMPLIVPPVYSKQFEKPLFSILWKKAVSAISTAREVYFLGYSLPKADFHARFILRCGFHNQIDGELESDGTRKAPTGRAEVTIVDPSKLAQDRIEDAVGWRCIRQEMTIKEWVAKRVVS